MFLDFTTIRSHQARKQTAKDTFSIASVPRGVFCLVDKNRKDASKSVVNDRPVDGQSRRRPRRLGRRDRVLDGPPEKSSRGAAFFIQAGEDGLVCHQRALRAVRHRRQAYGITATPCMFVAGLMTCIPADGDQGAGVEKYSPFGAFFSIYLYFWRGVWHNGSNIFLNCRSGRDGSRLWRSKR